MTPRSHAAQPALSSADVAVLKTLDYQRLLDSDAPAPAGDGALVPRNMLRPVRPHFDMYNERMLASGPCRLMIWDAPGDGSYSVSGVPTIATGVANRTGVAFAAGAAAGSLAMNLMSKRRAARDAQARWMDLIAQGAATVSTHGLYIEDPAYGLSYWNWSFIESVEWKNQSNVEMLIQNESGTKRLQFYCDWAELVFVNWVHACFPQHPGKYSWMTGEWLSRVRGALGVDPYTGQPVQLGPGR